MANIALKVGIDVSKSKFDVCYRSGNGTVSKTYSSGARSVKEFVSSLPEGSHCVMEATGVYHTRLAYALHEAGIIVSVVNPLVIKNFSRMRMARTKTDRADAELIMEYAEREDPPAWEPAEAECIKAHNCLVTIDLYQRQITAMRNEVEALEQSAVCDGRVMRDSCVMRSCRVVCYGCVRRSSCCTHQGFIACPGLRRGRGVRRRSLPKR